MLKGLLWNWGPWLYNQITLRFDYYYTVYCAIYAAIFSKKQWIFLKDTKHPVPSQIFDTTTIPEKDITWITSLNPVTFIDPAYVNSKDFKHVSYLGFIIHLPKDKTIDITDWINDIKWTGTKEPSPVDIFILWCCEKGSSLCYNTKDIQIEIITDEGDSIKKGLNDFTNTLIQENGGADTNGPNYHRTLDALLSSSGC